MQEKYNNKNIMLIILGLMTFLANGDNYAAASLIPNIAKDLGLNVGTAAISVTAYMLSFGIFTLLFGPLSDRFGKVKIINIAAVGTAVFSILGSFAFNLPSLIFFRAMNGMFAAGIFPVTMALIGETFDTKERHKAIGKVMGLAFLGGATATAIGGLVAYFASWRYVYLIYGVSELILAGFMLKILVRDTPVVKKLNIFSSYKEAFSNYRFMRLVTMLFFVGFCVFGSFTYSGIFLKESTGYNIFIIGLILALFGLGTVLGGQLAPIIRKKFKNGFLVFSGILGSVSLFTISSPVNIIAKGAGLLGFGIAFIFLQSTLITTAQEKLPKMRGTAMSLASFNMFLGAAVGTSVNGILMKIYGIAAIFKITSYIILGVGIIAAIFVSQFEIKKKTLQKNLS